ncbi:uncharacterized protein LOC122805592 isoform X2 [Protopterus annectens]|uniref:uncharacterized protein LOC122805592 isoform X2 n=1 Tax=Protopterus annectens TaxID=7888 RepID=UPI001CFA334C|nr:uncharacterized protein LOC122805592 isoform X2 [Protopterus annectens]
MDNTDGTLWYESLTLHQEDSGFYERIQTRQLSEVHSGITVLKEHESEVRNNPGFCEKTQPEQFFEVHSDLNSRKHESKVRRDYGFHAKTQARQLPGEHSNVTVLKDHESKVVHGSRFLEKTKTRPLSEVHSDKAVSNEHAGKTGSHSVFYEKIQKRQLSEVHSEVMEHESKVGSDFEFHDKTTKKLSKMHSDIKVLEEHGSNVASVAFTDAVSTDQNSAFTKTVTKPLRQGLVCSSSSDSFCNRNFNPEICTIYKEAMTAEVINVQNVEEASSLGLFDDWELPAEDSEIHVLSLQGEMSSTQNDNMSIENAHLCQACLTLYCELNKKGNQEYTKKKSSGNVYKWYHLNIAFCCPGTSCIFIFAVFSILFLYIFYVQVTVCLEIYLNHN